MKLAHIGLVAFALDAELDQKGLSQTNDENADRPPSRKRNNWMSTVPGLAMGRARAAAAERLCPQSQC